MTTTAIGTDRGRKSRTCKIQRYNDALFIGSDAKLFLGENDSDFYTYFNRDDTLLVLGSASRGTVPLAGDDVIFSDTQKLEFGDGADASINWDSSRLALGGTWYLSGADLHLSDTQQIMFGNEPGSDTGIQWSGSDLRIASASDLKLVAANNYILKNLPIANPAVSDALWRSDVISAQGPGGYLVFVSSG